MCMYEYGVNYLCSMGILQYGVSCLCSMGILQYGVNYLCSMGILRYEVNCLCGMGILQYGVNYLCSGMRLTVYVVWGFCSVRFWRYDLQYGPVSIGLCGTYIVLVHASAIFGDYTLFSHTLSPPQTLRNQSLPAAVSP